ncbi:hypothetical protein [Pseudomonas sp. Marseille-Q5115]|uniref:hypothetical protein n=1 Tax=Pseudomonas sp. Marseille-Q5115 TaxID=2866593 RepID=UPI001CE47C5A|nr:hypothetical protein [Pseudomonas sp. Marseille-Q5115]
MKKFSNRAVAAPEIPADAIADTTDNTLKRTAWESGLTVRQPAWANLPPVGQEQPAQAQLWVGANPDPDKLDGWAPVGTPYMVSVETEFPLQMEVPPDLLAREGPMALRVEITLLVGDIDYTDFVSFITDRTPPYEQATPPQAAVTPSPITDEALEDDIVVTVPSYPARRSGDVCSLYWVRFGGSWPPPGAEPILAGQPVPETGDITFTVPAASIVDAGSGSYVVSYVLADKAGNFSGFAQPRQVSVALGELATGLSAPRVPLAQESDDDVLVIADAIKGVVVEIPPFQNAAQGDAITLHWGQEVYEFVPSDWPFPGGPLEVHVPNPVLQREYGEATGDVDTEVAYEVVRGGLIMGSRQSTTIKVNFHVEGPTDPVEGWPDPINEALELPVLIPNSGGPNNALIPADFGMDAIVLVERVEGMSEGQSLRLYLDDQFLAEGEVPEAPSEGDTVPQLIEITVPWAAIQTRNNGTWSLYYHLVTPLSGNYWQSRSQQVTIAALPLPELIFPHVNTAGFLTCTALRPAEGEDENGDPLTGMVIHVEVPDLSYYLKAGDTLTLSWAPSSLADAPITRGQYSRTVQVGTTYPATGFIWEIPYDPYLLCIYEDVPLADGHIGRGRVQATFDAMFSGWTTPDKKQDVGMYTADSSCRVD